MPAGPPGDTFVPGRASQRRIRQSQERSKRSSQAAAAGRPESGHPGGGGGGSGRGRSRSSGGGSVASQIRAARGIAQPSLAPEVPRAGVPQVNTPQAQSRRDQPFGQAIVQTLVPPAIQAGRFLFGESTQPAGGQTIEQAIGVPELPPTAGGPHGVVGNLAQQYMTAETMRNQQLQGLLGPNAGAISNQVAGLAPGGGIADTVEMQVQDTLNMVAQGSGNPTLAAAAGPIAAAIGKGVLGVQEGAIGEIFMTPNDVVPVTGGGAFEEAPILRYTNPETGNVELLSGPVLGPEQIPDEVYHVTQYTSEIAGSGQLLASTGTSTGGFGGQTAPAVFFTTDPGDAYSLAVDLGRTARLAQEQLTFQDLARFAIEDAVDLGLPEGHFQAAVDEGLAAYSQYLDEGLRPADAVISAFKDYTGARAAMGGQSIPPLGADADNFAKVDPDAIDAIIVPGANVRGQIEAGALARVAEGPTTIAVHSHVPVQGAVTGNGTALADLLPGGVEASLFLLAPKSFETALENPQRQERRSAQEQAFIERGGELPPEVPAVGLGRTPGGIAVPSQALAQTPPTVNLGLADRIRGRR